MVPTFEQRLIDLEAGMIDLKAGMDRLYRETPDEQAERLAQQAHARQAERLPELQQRDAERRARQRAQAERPVARWTDREQRLLAVAADLEAEIARLAGSDRPQDRNKREERESELDQVLNGKLDMAAGDLDGLLKRHGLDDVPFMLRSTRKALREAEAELARLGKD